MMNTAHTQHHPCRNTLARRSGVQMRHCLQLVLCLILGALAIPPVAAQQPVTELPPITPFERARFRSLLNVKIDDPAARETAGTYGAGRLVLPDQGAVWLNNSSSTIGVAQIGAQGYANTDGQWRAVDSEAYRIGELAFTVKIFNQIDQLTPRATAIIQLGEREISGVTTTQYQLWVPGVAVAEIRNEPLPEAGTLDRVRLENTTFKYDLWIDSEGQMHQLNILEMKQETRGTGPDGQPVTLDAREINTLITYYDFDDPSITIEPPIPAPE